MRINGAGQPEVPSHGGHTRRCVIVNADDFGLSVRTNDGILQTHANGIVTSASLMVRPAAAADAARRAREFPGLGLGLHLDLGEWSYCDGIWTAVYEVLPTQSVELLATEVEHQLARFEELVGRKPTHLDSHQHVHRSEPLRSIMIKMAARLNVPLRFYNPYVQYRGDFYGQTAKGEPLPAAVSAQSLINLLGNLPAGISEIACHPGFDDELETMYANERREEVHALCSLDVRAAISMLGIELVSFARAAQLPSKPRAPGNLAFVGQASGKESQ